MIIWTKNSQKFVKAEMNQVVALIPLEVPDRTIAINWITLLDAEIGVQRGCHKKIKIDLVKTDFLFKNSQ